MLFVGPEVIPFGSLRQVNLYVFHGFGYIGYGSESFSGFRVVVSVERIGDRHDEQVASEHVFVVYADGLLVTREVHDERTHDAAAGLGGFATETIYIR